jgi:endonuclease/exonuclease/phosphatase family metal-dependent hydrolase
VRRTRRSKILLIVAASCLGTFVVLLALFFWACAGVQSPGDFHGPIREPDAERTGAIPASDTLVVLTWNIGFAYGIGTTGDGYEQKTAKQMEERLQRIGEAIRDSGSDIVLLQEVDFDSDRSHHVDQLEVLKRLAGLPHAAPAVSWRARFVPIYPRWLHPYGAVESGGAVLSRYPIDVNRVTLHNKPASKLPIYNVFYPFRYSQYVRIQWGDRVVGVLNNHLEAYSIFDREEQARAMSTLAGRLPGDRALTIVGGDLNTIPPEATQKRGFPDEENADFTDDETMAIVRAMQGFRDSVTVGEYVSHERAHFTFPADRPNRRLDYVFVSGEGSVETARVLRVGALSDHLPVRVVVRVR